MTSVFETSLRLGKFVRLGLLTGVLGLGLFNSQGGAAQEWAPTQNVEFVVGVGTGGGVDLAVRQLHKIIQENAFLPTSMTVVNKPGGSNSLGWIYINQHEGGGHYISILFPTFLTNSIAGTDTLARSDLTPIAMLFNDSTIFLVNGESDIKTPQDLIERLKSDPGSVTVGISAVGSGHHLAAAQLLEMVGGDPAALKTVVFASGGEMTTALRGNHVDMVVGAAGTAVGQMEGGGIRALAIAAPERLTGALAEVPTWKENGIDIGSSNWRGIAGPKNLGEAEVKFWADVFTKVVDTPEWKEQLSLNGYQNALLTSTELTEFMDAEEVRLRGLFTAIGLAQ